MKINKLSFFGVEDKDVYNISKTFKYNHKEFLFGRVEPRDNSELSKVFLFRKEGKNCIVDKNFRPLENSEDPFVSFVGGDFILGCTEVIKTEKKHEFSPGNKLNYRILFYHGKDMYNLEKFWEGPWSMKDIRFIQLPNKSLAVFSRPQGKIGERGKIGFLIVNFFDELNETNLYNAPLLNLFGDSKWGGVNDVHLLENGKLGVLGHIAKENDNKTLTYYPMIFVLDYENMKYSQIKILFRRKDLPEGVSKSERLKDVLFPGGLIKDSEENIKIYLGAGDAEAYEIIMKNPFLNY